MNIYEQAVMSQSACNLSGLCHALPKIADAIWAEIRAGNDIKDGKLNVSMDTTKFNNHPVMRLFAEQFFYLTYGKSWSEAWEICEKKAKETA